MEGVGEGLGVCQVFTLPEMTVELCHVRDVVHCVLHTILFGRALGLVHPLDAECQHLDVTYVQCGDKNVARLVHEKAKQLYTWLERGGAPRAQVVVSFYERRHHKKYFFSKQPEKRYWEQWRLPILVPDATLLSSTRERATDAVMRRAATRAAVSDILLHVVRLLSEARDHLPPVTSADAVSFPFEISVPTDNDSGFGFDMLKRMLQASPPSVL